LHLVDPRSGGERKSPNSLGEREAKLPFPSFHVTGARGGAQGNHAARTGLPITGLHDGAKPAGRAA
jgi:hypothetical protein